MLALEDKELGKVTIKPTPLSSKVSYLYYIYVKFKLHLNKRWRFQSPEWHRMVVSKNNPDQDVRIKIACRLDKPLNMKHCGYV